MTNTYSEIGLAKKTASPAPVFASFGPDCPKEWIG
jgi:hypothetical protein